MIHVLDHIIIFHEQKNVKKFNLLSAVICDKKCEQNVSILYSAFSFS
jgi:hypothetical protein